MFCTPRVVESNRARVPLSPDTFCSTEHLPTDAETRVDPVALPGNALQLGLPSPERLL
jgi:hypothetical protein